MAPGEEELRQKRRQLQLALQSLRAYNPDFRLTPEVLEIMRVFFDDLRPDARDSVSLRALVREIERLDPDKRLVPEETRQIMWRDITLTGADERLDFPAFCEWVMRWKDISPLSVQNVYMTWAKQIATVDFNLSEGEDVFVVLRPEQSMSSEELTKTILELLQTRRKLRARGSGGRRGSVGTKGDQAAATKAHEPHGFTANPSFEPATVGVTPSETDNDDDLAEEEEEEPVGSESDDSAAKTDGPLSTLAKKGSIITVSKSFIAGGAAGIVAKSMLAPMDRVKIMFQVTDKHRFSFRNALRLGRSIVVHDGLPALFRGNMLNIMRVVPYAGLQHSGFDYFRRKFHAYNYRQAEKKGDHQLQKLSNVQLVTAGSLAGALSLVVAYPLDIVRARYMVQHGKQKHTSVYEMVVSMYKVEGLRSFSRGLVPSLLGTLPYTGIGFSLNERFKSWMLDFQHGRRDKTKDTPDMPPPSLNPASKFLCSYFAACIAQTTTYPMDTIRRRIQTDGYVTGSHGELRYTGVMTTARIIMTHEGWRGLFKGVSVNWMRSPLSTGISLTTYDLLKELMGIEKVE